MCVCLCQVTYEDEGTYTQRDYWNKEISTVIVAVTRELSQPWFPRTPTNFSDRLLSPEWIDFVGGTSFCFFIVVSSPARNNYLKCVAGESLHISLEGIVLADAELSFSGEAANVTLVRRVDVQIDGWIEGSMRILNDALPQVRDGAPVARDLMNYWDRVRTHSTNIEIRNVNYTDEGRYTLRDRSLRVVSVTRMDLTGKSPLWIHDAQAAHDKSNI